MSISVICETLAFCSPRVFSFSRWRRWLLRHLLPKCFLHTFKWRLLSSVVLVCVCVSYRLLHRRLCSWPLTHSLTGMTLVEPQGAMRTHLDTTLPYVYSEHMQMWRQTLSCHNLRPDGTLVPSYSYEWMNFVSERKERERERGTCPATTIRNSAIVTTI